MRAAYGLEFDGKTLKLHPQLPPTEETPFREVVEGDGRIVTAILRAVAWVGPMIPDSDPWEGALAAQTTEDGRTKLWIKNAEGERFTEVVIAFCNRFYPKAHVQLFDQRGAIARELFLQE